MKIVHFLKKASLNPSNVAKTLLQHAIVSLLLWFNVHDFLHVRKQQVLDIFQWLKCGVVISLNVYFSMRVLVLVID